MWSSLIESAISFRTLNLLALVTLALSWCFVLSKDRKSVPIALLIAIHTALILWSWDVSSQALTEARELFWSKSPAPTITKATASDAIKYTQAICELNLWCLLGSIIGGVCGLVHTSIRSARSQE